MVDKHENIVILTEVDQLNNCNGNTTSKKVGECLGALFDVAIQVSDTLGLTNRLKFQPGNIYYFTSKLAVLVQVLMSEFKRNEVCKIVKQQLMTRKSATLGGQVHPLIAL